MKNLFRVRKNDKFGYIDIDGKLIIDFGFDFASDFKDGLARIKYKDEWGYIDSIGNIVFTVACDLCTDFNEGFAVIERDNKSGYIDKSGMLAIDCRFYESREFHSGIALVLEDISSSGNFINKNGEVILPSRNYLLSKYNEGLINVVEKGKWGYIDINNNFLIKPKYNSAKPFYEGKAAVALRRDIYGFIIGHAVIKFKKDRNYGVINTNGKSVVNSKFQHIDKFNGGLAEVIIGDNYDEFLYGYVNYDGEYVWEPTR